MNIPRILLPICLALAILAVLPTTACSRMVDPDLAVAIVWADLVAPGGGPTQGHVGVLLSQNARNFGVDVEGLAPNTHYELTSNGATIASFSTDAGGAATVNRAPETLGFDPRERTFAVREPGGTDALVMRDPDATQGGTMLVEHAPLSAFIGGKGASAFFANSGVWTFRVELYGVQPGDYALWIDGTPRATIHATSGAGAVAFSSAPGGDVLRLDFDPRAALIEILHGDESAFAGSGHAEFVGIDFCLQANHSQDLVAESVGTGVATLRTRTDCSHDFRVAISGVPMGDYDLAVGGVVRGSITVGEDENGATDGTLAFTPNGDPRLDFDPVGAPIDVWRGDQLVFSLDAFAP